MQCPLLITQAQAEIEKWRIAKASVEKWKSLGFLMDNKEAILKLHGELCTEGHTKTPASSRMQKQQRKFGMGVDWFVSPNNFEVIVGRSAASNERVSFELAPKNGLWFHAACPGAHVAFMC